MSRRSGAIRERPQFCAANLALMLLAARGAVLGWEIGREGPAIAQESSLLVRIVVLAMVFFGFSPLVTGLQNLSLDPAYARDDYRAVAARIEAEAGPSAAVILDAPNQREVFTYYYPDGPGITPLPDDTPKKTIARLLAENRRLYAVFWGQSEQDPEGIVESTLQAGAFQVDATWYGKVRLVTYAVAAARWRIDRPVALTSAIRCAGWYTISRASRGRDLGVTFLARRRAHPDRL
jgi:hypothetical protein